MRGARERTVYPCSLPRFVAAIGPVLLLMCWACGPASTVAEPTPTPEPKPTAESRPADIREEAPVDALLARRQDAALRVCDALENSLLFGDPSFFLGALRFAEAEGVRRSDLMEAMERACPGPLRVLRYEPDLIAEFEKLR